MTKTSLHRFAITAIDPTLEPTRLYEIVEHHNWECAFAHAFDVAREKLHEDRQVATAVFELSPDGSALRRVAVAGTSRLSTGSGTGSASAMLASMVAMAA